MLEKSLIAISFFSIVIICKPINLFCDNAVAKRVSFWFIDTCLEGGILTSYPATSTIEIVKDEVKARDNVLKFKLDDRDYSGVEIIPGDSNFVDLSQIRYKGAIRFWVRGLLGGESFSIGLMDYGVSGLDKAEVRVRSKNHFKISKQWQQVVLPLSSFPDEGERWLQKNNCQEYAHIDWKRIFTFKISADKEENIGRSENRIATIFLDEIEVIDNAGDHRPVVNSWRLLEDTVSGPEFLYGSSDNVITTFIDSQIRPLTSFYTYGGMTDYSVKKTSFERSVVLAGYFADNEWSGITICQGKSVDVAPYRDSGALEFRVRGEYGGEIFTIGLLDDESDGLERKVQTRLPSRQFVKVTTEWQTVRVPFCEFNDAGRWWHSEAHYEALGTMDWNHITEVRFSTDKLGNREISDMGKKPVRIYFADIKLVKKTDVFRNEKFWSTFKSDLPDKMICQFEEPDMEKYWTKNICSKTMMEIGTGYNEINASRAAKIDYRIALFGSAAFSFDGVDSVGRNWNGFSGIKFDFYCSEPAQSCMVMITDSTNEAWCSVFDVKKGWQQVVVDFRTFKLYEWWQPDNVVINRKMDMGWVNSIDFRPGVNGAKGTLMVDNIRVTNSASELSSDCSRLKINQVGYLPDYLKMFVIADSVSKGFGLLDTNGFLVYNGKLRSKGFWNGSSENLKVGDFSSVKQTGKYQIVIQESGDKEEIVIDENPYRNLLDAAVKAFYFQRISTELSPENAGIWARKAGIPDTACPLHVTAGRSGCLDVSGGWMDAGDYGKYIVNAGITVGTLLALYELFPACIHDSLNIPESKNGISDLLDEVRYEIEWMKKMQDKDGGVFFKVGSLKWDGFIQPHEVENSRYVMGKSTTSTLNFAAVMAMVARIYKFDKFFSNDCRKRAMSAWNWAQKNPSVQEPPENGGTGLYEDTRYTDEFFWAASELYITTKKNVFSEYLRANTAINKVRECASWNDVRNLGWYSLVSHFNNRQFDIVSIGSHQIIAVADTMLKLSDSLAYRLPAEVFMWGSNSDFLNRAILMLYAHKLTNQKKYLEGALGVTDYILGMNATGFCYVTGFGKNSPLQPHHRAMASDGVDAPYPGFVVGGPNSDRQDEMSNEPGVSYPNKEPARAYIDRMAAYACNEVAINWNAALVFVLGYLNSVCK
ncbi:MAG: hypothetical protein GX640_10525 [Fibrobacter sp.]|nr:hypothetical protein [Fibrobacter sp.]